MEGIEDITDVRTKIDGKFSVLIAGTCQELKSHIDDPKELQLNENLKIAFCSASQYY
jgi:hypothetical protein